MRSLTETRSLLRGLLKTLNGPAYYREKLDNIGLCSFRPWAGFHQELCKRLAVPEYSYVSFINCKLWMESPNGILSNDEGLRKYYWGELENQIIRRNVEEFKKLKSNINDEYNVLREKEKSLFSDFREHDLSQSLQKKLSSRLSKAMNIYGFLKDFSRTNNDRDVISKPISNDWVLCVSGPSLKTPIYKTGETMSYVNRQATEVRYYLQSARSTKYPSERLKLEDAGVIWLRIEALVDGFNFAYRGVHTDREIPVIVEAHSAIYGLVRESIEPYLRDALP